MVAQTEKMLIVLFYLQQLPLVLVQPKGNKNVLSAILCYEREQPQNNACILKCHARFGTLF